jgi:hypothetical protein
MSNGFLSQEEVSSLLRTMGAGHEEAPMSNEEQKFLTRTEGYYKIDIPPAYVPTMVTTYQWFVTSPAVRVLFYIILGIVIGQSVAPMLQTLRTVPVVPAVETLESFVARESQTLTAGERKTLITVTEKILGGNFETPSALREEFYFQRLKAGLQDSANFVSFWEKFVAKVGVPAEDNLESTRSVYESLLRGLKVQAYNDISGEPVESLFPLDHQTHVHGADEPVSPSILEESSQESEDRSQELAKIQVQRQRIFRRR